MTELILNILLTVLLVLLNAFFVAAEFAIVKVRISQIELRVRSGSRLAKLTKHLILHLDAYLSATQLGITLSSLGLGWIGEPVVAKVLIDIIHFLGLGISEQLIHKISLPLAFVLITILHIVFGELAPKSLAIQRSEQVSLFIALPLRLFYFIFSPFIWILNGFANLFIKLIGFEPVTESQNLHSSDELRYIIEESSKSGSIEPTEHKLIENIFEFKDTPIKQIMVPRGKIVAIEASMTINQAVELFKSEGYSRMPIFDQSIDNIIGIVFAKDLIGINLESGNESVKNYMKQAFFVSEEEKISNIMKIMQRDKIHLAIVLDEFGGTAGLVTMEDILEEIVGEIQDEYDEEIPLIEKISETEFQVNPSVPINDANDTLPFPLPEDEEYETIGGLVISKLGRIPEINEVIDLGDYLCTVLKRSKRKVELLRLTLKEKTELDEV
ncbi:MAG: hemolysin family protein [Candidatus Kapabacteria bacterium]|nr:hemolysin family protein [Candidatus Kapabacteria bacterium]